MTLNWFDIVIILGMLGWVLAGLSNGLIREAINLGGLFLGLILASRYTDLLAGMLTALDPQVSRIVAFVIIVFAVAFVAHWIGSVLHRVVTLLFLGWLDHILGAGFGVVKGVLIFTLVIAILMRFPLFGAEIGVRESSLAPAFDGYLPLVASVIPGVFDVFQALLNV